MELPSMVQRSGDMLIVRSVVSGDQLYSNKFSDDESAAAGAASSAKTAKKQTPLAGDSLAPKYGPNEHLEYQTHRQPIVSPLMLEQQLEMYCAAAVAQKQHFLQQQQQQQHAAAASAVMDAVAHQQAIDLKEEGLPQCKIKRNYSCTYCTYFTQNPRYHLTHLRDVHGEKIFINKCKLCLYASRHFQKLVRHMKMVHGCTDGVTGANGQSRGKRGMSREVRKRKLEESVGLVGVGEPLETPTMEQVKTEMDLQNQKLQREIEAYKQHQTPDHQQLVQHATEAIYAVAANYERQLKEAKAMQTAGGGASLDLAGPLQASPLHSNGGRFRSSHSPSLTRHGSTPSPSGSGSPSRRSTPNALGFADEAVASSGQNRLVKCSMCDFATVYPGQLVEHEQEEHRKTKFFRCEKCSYVTHIKARFSKHVKYHSMPMIKCVTCDFRTPYKWNLDRHMKNHGGAGPFKCAACDFTADIKQSLTVHEMNHHVPPVGHAAGMSLARRRNKVGGTDLCDDFLSDSAELEEDQYPHNNNNNLDDYDDSMMLGPDGYPAAEVYGKRFKYDGEEPTDLSQKGGSSDTSSVHNQSIGSASKAKRSIPDLIPFKGKGLSALNLSKDFPLRSGLTDIASMFLNEKALSEILQSSADKLEASQLSPTTTVASMPSSQVSRGLLATKKGPSSVGSGSIFDRMKFTAMSGGVTNENLVCPCGHMAKCLSESIIHRKTCKAAAMDDAMEDDDDEEPDDTDGRLEIDFANGDDDDRQSHSALNLSVTGSTRCQHCRHRCKSSADLLNHLKFCTEVGGRYGNDSPVSGESNTGRSGGGQHQAHDNRVSIWNKMPRHIANGHGNGERGMLHEGGQASGMTSGGHNSHGNGSSEENSYYGVETAPGYGEVTKKMTPEEEAANSSLKKVYKCPHCSFWASTASRFHVHIVGHLNKKPFECSLCSYRSNWRWDITKHIRLKTIRDPSHKNARVLMNDETGRRNYTKYNKYITLMKVTEEDGDPKLMKSGEMTPNQVASLSFINDFNKSALSPSTVSHLNGLKDDITLEPVLATKKPSSNGLGGYLDAGDQLADNLIHLPMFATMMNAAMAQQQHQQHQQNSREQEHATMITPSVTISAVKRSNSMPVKPSDDMIVEVKQEGNEKSTYYSCRKCSFRHSNRDAVLAHIKTHYADPNYPIVTATPTKVNSTYNKLLAAMCQQQNNNNNNTISNNNNNNKGLNLLASGGLLQQAIQGGERPFSGLALALAGKKSPAESAGAILEHGEQKASQNERHCRLKHAGDIRIETLDRSTTSSKPIYKSLEQQLSVNTNPATMNNSNNNNNSTNKLDHLLNSPLANNAAIAAALSTIANAVANGGGNAQDIQAAAAYLAALNVGSSSGKFNMDDLMLHQQLQQNDQIEVTRLGAGAAGGTTSNLAQLLENNNNNNNNQNNQNASLPQNSKSKQQKCPLCPHVSESKSQMNYHISLHKPTQYECSLCTFVCAKKQHLSSHMRTVHHQQPQQQQANNSSAASLNMDFSMALQFAAAAKAQQQQQQQQQESASNQMVIDLTALKSSSSDSKASSDTLPVVSYCPKCPARFPHGRSDLLEHLKHHAAAHSSYRCKFCDFADDSDEAIQAHRYVHSQRYQDKLDDLKSSTKEDTENRPPKFMQITAGQQKEAIWIVDSDLGVDGPLKAQQQNASISSSSASCASSSSLMAATKFDTANSLLKKQLEAGPVGATAKRQSSPAPGGESMATDETASEAGDSSNESVASHLEKHLDETSEEAAEKCMLCPYETKSTELYKEHLQHHASVSKSEKAFTCDHCDYADDEKAAIEEHTRVHFNAMQKLASIAFFTSYDKLELSIEEEEKEPKDEGEEEHGSEEASGQDVEEAAELQPVKIKLEHHNNNNEDDAVNENVLQELLKDASNVGVKKELAKSHEQEQDGDATPPPPSKPPTTKIILYKNDGCLSIKKDSPAAEKGGDSISDRLRRRRSAAAAAGHHDDAGANEHGDEANDGGDEEDEQTADEHQEQSHKILVNAKTGQVISKH